MSDRIVNWRKFLDEFNAELIENDEFASTLDPEAEGLEWLGFHGASEQMIALEETRLGVRLPPSYRAFLLTSNGWRGRGLLKGALLHVDELAWFRERNREWLNIYFEHGEPHWASDDDYFRYDDDVRDDADRLAYLREALEIGEVRESYIALLNPAVVTADGEWEAWRFSGHEAGARRFRSFGHMMRSELERLR